MATMNRFCRVRAAFAFGLIVLVVAGPAGATQRVSLPGKSLEAAVGEIIDADADADGTDTDKVAVADESGNAVTVFASSGWAASIYGSPLIDIRAVGIRWSHRWPSIGRGLLRGNPTFSAELIPAALGP